jgi:hypothetical protein|tara:strand:- start:4624 stop:5172 length:549 start_codon:yes stop_codon:yes gene_type:complete
MNSKETLNKVKTLLGLEIKLEERRLENGTRFEADSFEAGKEIFIVTDEDERIALPQGEYILDDGMIVVVEEEGIISEIKEAMEEEVEETVEAPVVEEVEAVTEDEMRDMMGRIQNLEDAIADLKADKESKVDASVDLSSEVETPVAIKHNPESKGEVKQVLFSQNKPMSTQDRVFAKLFNNN